MRLLYIILKTYDKPTVSCYSPMTRVSYLRTSESLGLFSLSPSGSDRPRTQVSSVATAHISEKDLAMCRVASMDTLSQEAFIALKRQICILNRAVPDGAYGKSRAG
jgi:hypothetical protein